MLGLSLIRGAPTPVIDAAKLLGSAGGEPVTRFVTIRVGERHAAVALSSVIGVRELPAASLSELPPLLQDAGAEAVESIGALDSTLLVVLESARVVPESVWRAMEARA
jgi:purine-binding chemotaxis protein CheW